MAVSRVVRGNQNGCPMIPRSNELLFDPVVFATLLFGVVTAAFLVTAI